MGRQIHKKNILRAIVICLWVGLFGALLQRHYFIRTIDFQEERILQRAREESFLGIYFREERIGYVKNRLVRSAAGKVTLYQDAFMNLNILDQVHPVSIRVKAELTPGFLLRNFIFNLSSPFYKTEAEGEVVGQEVRFTMSTGKGMISDSIHLDKPPFLSTNQRGYLLKQGLQAGDKIKIPYFDPISLAGKDTIMEYQGREKKLILGRIHNLHHFVESFAGMRINSWLDDQGRVVREESPAGFVFIAEPEFKATDLPSRGTEILSAVSVPVTGVMPEPTSRQTLTYRLVLPADGEFVLDKDRQTLEGDMLTVTREEMPDAEAAVCMDRPAELASTPYIQSKNLAITRQSRMLTADLDSPLAKVRVLADWVYENLEKRPVLGIPDALTTLQTRMGDCNEHAALFAALARNAGIPTRVAAGVMFYEGAFFYHAWNEVCLAGEWLSLDTTKNQLPADVSHIKFVEGETDEQIKIGALLGNLAIEVVSDARE